MQNQLHIVLLCLIPSTIFISCLILHFRQHYRCNRCNCCNKTPPKSTLPPTYAKKHTTESEMEIFLYHMLHQTKCPKLFLPVDDEVFNFFPKSFILYLSYLIFLTLLILINTIVNNHSEPWLLHKYTFTSLSHINAYTDTDWILIYCILIIYIWDSLYSFYRYYSTFFIATRVCDVETHLVVCKFMYFTIPFCILFMICIHFYYCLYPFIIVIHLYFNCYCTYKHSSILIQSYSQSNASCVSVAITKINNKMLKNVYFIRKIQLISCIISTLSMSLFLFVYDAKIIIYLPILWSISCLLLTLNFVRNRQCIYHTLFMIYQTCKFKLRSSIKTQNDWKNVDFTNPDHKTLELQLSKIILKDTKSEPMISPKLETHDQTFSSSVSKITTIANNTKILSDSAPTSPNTQDTDEYIKEKRKSKIMQSDYENEIEENVIFFNDNSSNPIEPYSRRILLTQSHSDPIAPNYYDLMNNNNENTVPKLERFLTEPLPTNHDHDEYGDEKKQELWRNLTVENALEIRQMQRSKCIIKKQTETEEKYNENNNDDPLAVDVCFDVLISQGFADRQQLNSIKQLRQFNHKKLPKNIIM